jgi:hypothetical protein
VGAKPARPLLVKLLNDDTVYPYGGYAHLYRHLGPHVPERTAGDVFSSAMVKAFALNGDDFGLQPLAHRLLAAHRDKKVVLTADELRDLTNQAKQQNPELLFYPTLAARQRGCLRLIKWMDEEMEQTIKSSTLVQSRE